MCKSKTTEKQGDADQGHEVFHLHALATPPDVRDTLKKIQVAMQQTPLPATVSGDVHLLLGEVLNNIAEHAYPDATPGAFCVCMQDQGTQLYIEVRDGGGPMPGGRLPEGKPVDIDVAMGDLPEGGFGWALIHTLASRITYRRLQGENQLEIWVSTDPD